MAFTVGSLGYDLGRLLEMGPGYLPLVLGLLLAALGVATVVKAYAAPDPVDVVQTDGDPTEPAPDLPDLRPLAGLEWRPVVMIVAAIVFFAGTIDGLGVLPTTFGTVLLASLARGGVSWVRVLVMSVGLTALCWAVFVLALQLRLPLFGDWLGG